MNRNFDHHKIGLFVFILMGVTMCFGAVAILCMTFIMAPISFVFFVGAVLIAWVIYGIVIKNIE